MKFLSGSKHPLASIQDMIPGTKINDLIPRWYRRDAIDEDNKPAEEAILYILDRWIEENNVDPQKIATNRDIKSLQRFVEEKMVETLHAVLIQSSKVSKDKQADHRPRTSILRNMQ